MERLTLEVFQLVGVVKTFANSAQNGYHMVKRKGGSFLIRSGHDRIQILTKEMLHTNKVRSLNAAEVINLDDVWVVQESSQFRLVNECMNKLLLICEMGKNPFDGYNFFKALIPCDHRPE
jgi:hypothetical protein